MRLQYRCLVALFFCHFSVLASFFSFYHPSLFSFHFIHHRTSLFSTHVATWFIGPSPVISVYLKRNLFFSVFLPTMVFIRRSQALISGIKDPPIEAKPETIKYALEFLFEKWKNFRTIEIYRQHHEIDWRKISFTCANWIRINDINKKNKYGMIQLSSTIQI